MCDYSLDFVASRPAKVGDKLVTTKFKNSVTRGFAAIEEPTVAVCVLPGTEIAFEQDVEYCHSLLPNQKVAERLARFRQINKEQASAHHAGISEWKDHSARPAVRRPARDRASVASFSARYDRSGPAEARFSRYLIGPLSRLPGSARTVGVPMALPTGTALRGMYLGPMNYSVEGNPAGRPSGRGIALRPGLAYGVATATVMTCILLGL